MLNRQYNNNAYCIMWAGGDNKWTVLDLNTGDVEQYQNTLSQSYPDEEAVWAAWSHGKEVRNMCTINAGGDIIVAYDEV